MQTRRTDTALLRADLLVEVEQVARYLCGHTRALAGSRAEFPFDVGDDGVTPLFDSRHLRRELVAFGEQGAQPALRVLAAFHHFEHRVFEVASSAGQRC